MKDASSLFDIGVATTLRGRVMLAAPDRFCYNLGAGL